ncbi:MAG: HAD family phosphatase [Candidatus Delongbacteria bacterium]|nr:HAD family phosphatase [Candidatus Delongbacteria bacterium]
MTRIPQNLRAVLFDADGVIIRSLESHCIAWTRIFAELGVELDDLEIRLREGESAESTFKTLAMLNGLQFTDTEVSRWVERKRSYYRSLAVEIYPEVRPLLVQIHQAELAVGLVTGSSIVNLQHVLGAAELAMFDVIFTAEDYTHGKPSAEPYSRAVAALEVEPAEAVVIENAPLGIESARAAGIHCIALATTLPAERLQLADQVLANHAELSSFLKTWIGGGV